MEMKKQVGSSNNTPTHNHLVSVALDILHLHQSTIGGLSTPPPLFSSSYRPVRRSTSNTTLSSPRLYYHHPHTCTNNVSPSSPHSCCPTLAAIIALPPRISLQTVVHSLLSSHHRPLWDIHCPIRPTVLAVPTSTSTYETRDIHPGRLTSPIRMLQLHELPIAARRLVLHRQWNYPALERQQKQAKIMAAPAAAAVFVLSETSAYHPWISMSAADVPFTTVVIPAPCTIGWIIIATSSDTFALVAFDDVSLGGWLPNSMALELRQRMMINRLNGIASCCRNACCSVAGKVSSVSFPVSSNSFPPDTGTSLHHHRHHQRHRTAAAAAIPKTDPHHYLSPLSRSVSVWAFAPQLLSHAASSYGPIERFKYTIACFVAGIHTTTTTTTRPIIAAADNNCTDSKQNRIVSPLPHSTHLNLHAADGFTTGLSSTVNVDLESLSIAPVVAAVNANPNPNANGARLRLHVPTLNSVEFLMTSRPSGAFEVGGTWTFNRNLIVTGEEGTTYNMHGKCVISFADSSHIEIDVVPVSSSSSFSKDERTVHFEDPQHRLTCNLQISGGALSGSVLYDGSAVSTISGNWRSAVLFDKWEGWRCGSFQTKVSVVEDDVDEATSEYKLVKGTWIPSKTTN